MLRLFENLAHWYDTLEAKHKFFVRIALCTIIFTANIAFGVVLWVTAKALYPLASGWTAFGFVWLLLIGGSSILSNIAKGVIAGGIVAWRDYKATRDRGAVIGHYRRAQP